MTGPVSTGSGPTGLGARLGSSRLFAALLAAHVVLKLLLLPRALGSPFRGDEITYNISAMEIANVLQALVTTGRLSTGVLAEEVVGHGWFMPGMPLLLTPVYLVAPDASLTTVRCYVGVLTTLLLVAAALAARRWIHPVAGAALLVVPGLLPMWLLFSYSSWGDLSAGLMIVVLVALLTRQATRERGGQPPGPRAALLLGVLLAVTLYLRSSALPLVVGLLVLAALGSLALLPSGQRVRGLAATAGAAAVFAALLAPWSVAASRSLDDRVVTTTTMPISLAYAFGDRTSLCFGPCPPGSIWYHMVRYSKEIEQLTGVGELEVQRQMSAYALRDLTPSGYAAAALDNMDRYVLQPTGYAHLFGVDPDRPSAGDRAITVPTTIGYFALLALAMVALAWPRRRQSFTDQVAWLLSSLVWAALMIQPLVHVGTARYWPVFAPVLGILAVTGLATAASARASSEHALPEQDTPEQGTPGQDTPGQGAGPSRLLRTLQHVVTGLWVLVLSALALLAA